MDSAASFPIVTPVSLSTEKGVYKGMPVEAWEPMRTRRASYVPPRSRDSASMNRGRSLQVSVQAAVMDLPPIAQTPTQPDDSARTRRHRRRYSEHPPVRQGDNSENNKPPAAGATVPHTVPVPRRPKREPTLDLNDVHDALSGHEEPRRARRWADTPGASSVAAWVQEQQVQAQYQFAPLSPPLPSTPKASKGFMGKVKKLIGKPKPGE